MTSLQPDMIPQVDLAHFRSKAIVLEPPKSPYINTQEVPTKKEIAKKAETSLKNDQIHTVNPLIGAVEIYEAPKKTTRKQKVNKVKDLIVEAFLGKDDDPDGEDRFLNYVEVLKLTKPQIATKLLIEVMNEKEDLTIIDTQAPIVIIQSSPS